MNFDYTPKVQALREQLLAFMKEHVEPNEHRFNEEVEANRKAGNAWVPTKIVEELKLKAKSEGLWNLFLPHSSRMESTLSNIEYAPLAEIMGKIEWAPEVFNCSAPDSGNMETLELYGTEEQKKQWLDPLMAGEIRSSFVMTEPAVASSDATNIQTSIVKEGDEYVINGVKSWISGAGDPRTKIYIVMGKTNPEAERHKQQSMVLVPVGTPGVSIDFPYSVYGYDDAPYGHMRMTFKDVRVPTENILLGEGRGFEIAQGRLGPGRIHHCMRCIGVAEYALELMIKRGKSRVAFGKPITDHGTWRDRIAESRMMIDQARLLVLKAAHMMDTVGNKVARSEIAQIKVIAPRVSTTVLDWAIQMHGSDGLSQETPLAELFKMQRIIRLADGPDEVHRNAVAKSELYKYK